MAPSEVDAAIRRCFESGKYSDLTVQSSVREFKVHKLVVCEQSEWFENAMKKDTFLEGETSIVKMDDDEPDAVAAMLEFMYKENYEDPYPSAMSKDSPESHGHIMMFHLHIWALADRHQISKLKDLAENNFSNVIYKHWNDPSFPAAVQFVYSIAPPNQSGKDLKAIVLNISAKQANELFADPNHVFENMMDNVAEFGKDLSKWQAAEQSKDSEPSLGVEGEELTCPGCSFSFKAKLRDDLDYLTCPACTTNEAVNIWREDGFGVLTKNLKGKKGKKGGRMSNFGMY